MSDIAVARPADGPIVGEILARGFHDDPLMGWLFEGDDDARATKLAAFFGFLAVEANVPLGESYLSDGACICWCPPPGVADWPDERSARFGELLGSISTGTDLERLGVLGERFDAAHPTEPHWYLGLVAVVPEQQGNGAGSALLAHTLARVDADHAPAYLESSNPRNVGLYERFGFEVVDEILMDDGGPLVPTMWRPAR
jgi:ribosomal protein S18 acetylase RimI-like enzyme